MGVRRKARELALKMVFEIDFSEALFDGIVARVRQEKESEAEVIDFAQQIALVYLGNQSAVDALIEQHSNNWKLSRMASVDRNILRLGVAEILYLEDVPKNVTINEYLEIAKKFGTDESSSFINGILDKIQ